MTASSDLNEYRALVLGVMRDASAGDSAGLRVFENYGTEHARIVLETMIRAARETIDIYSQDLNAAAFSGELLKQFVDRGGKTRILIESTNALRASDSALRALAGLPADRCEVRVLKGAKAQHLTIVDGAHVRIETSHADRKATVAFGHPALASQAAQVFEQLWIGSPLAESQT